MTYNIKNAKEIEQKPLLDPDVIHDGVIRSLTDGKYSDFVDVEVLKTWKNASPDQTAVELEIEIPCEKADKGHLIIHKVMPYEVVDDVMEYGSKSNLGKYKAKYGKLPELADQVKVSANKDGFGKLKLD